MDQWSKLLDEGGRVDSIYLDFKKAFDTVPHRRLIQKLASYSFSEEMIGWNKEFLNGREQFVTVNGATSSSTRVTSGIPQGSVLGPILFVIYINDLPANIVTNVKMFADDTKIYKKIGSAQDSLNLQRDLDSLEQWSNDWLLKFHPGKCAVLDVDLTKRKAEDQYEYKLENTILNHVEYEKDLGVITDTKLNFREHI